MSNASEMRKLMEDIDDSNTYDPVTGIIVDKNSYSLEEVLTAFQDLLDSTSLQAYAQHQHVADVNARKILKSFGVKSSMREDEDEEEFDWKSEMETGIVIGEYRGGKYTVTADGKHLDNFKDWDDMMKAISRWMDVNNYWPNIFHVNERGNVSHIDKEGNEIKGVV